MPLYAYKCEQCEYSCQFFHGIDESAGKCPKCSSNFIKQFPANNNIKVANNKDSAGKRVEKFIEESREALKEQLSESRKEYKQ